MAYPIKVNCMTSTSVPRDTNSIENTGAAACGGRPLSLSMALVSLGRLVLVVHLTLIGYGIGYFQNQDPHGYPDILI